MSCSDSTGPVSGDLSAPRFSAWYTRTVAYVPVTPAVVAWAVQRSGFSLQEIAEATGASPSNVRGWLAGREHPTVTQARKLAHKLKRPLAFLLWPEPPEDSTPEVAFRAPLASEVRDLNPVERRYIRQAHRLQRTVAWLRDELGEPASKLPRVDIQSDPSEVADRIRALVGVSIDEQFEWSSDAVAMREWRSRLEGMGLLVFLLSLGRDSCRGMTIAENTTPVVIVNTAINHAARIFTLFHELGHVLTNTTSACAPNRHRFDRRSEPNERWCEKFAAAVLMPWPNVDAFLADRGVHGRVTDLSTVGRLARRFRVSLQAATLRLINNRRAQWTLWDAIPRDANAKSGRGGQPDEPRTTPVIRLGEFGRAAAEIFVRGLDADLIERSQAASYLRIGDDALSEIQRRINEAA